MTVNVPVESVVVVEAVAVDVKVFVVLKEMVSVPVESVLVVDAVAVAVTVLVTLKVVVTVLGGTVVVQRWQYPYWDWHLQSHTTRIS